MNSDILIESQVKR